MESVLTSVKKNLGIEEDDESFDVEVVTHINAAIMRLMTLGVGPTSGLIVSDKTTPWSELLGERTDLEGAKLYIYLKVRMLFDPPTSSYVLDAMKRQADELESILNMLAETTGGEN